MIEGGALGGHPATHESGPRLGGQRKAGRRMTSSGAVPSVGGSCFVAGAGRRRRFVALRPRARVRCRVHAIEGSPLAAR